VGGSDTGIDDIDASATASSAIEYVVEEPSSLVGDSTKTPRSVGSVDEEVCASTRRNCLGCIDSDWVD
jgi:hypothetical protein